jgi:hypothetical protein
MNQIETEQCVMAPSTYLVFGDLHGRILPAFRLALAWQREHGERLNGLLQVGDLGWFPDSTRLDKATKRHAQRDSLELGAQDVAVPSRLADAIFADAEIPPALWFTAGNHEDHEALKMWEHGVGASSDDFPIDAYMRIRCLRDGHVTLLPGELRVGALWGIDDRAPNARRKSPRLGRVVERSATHLSYERFDVLLTHESPRDAIFKDAGSELISTVIDLAQPGFAFFGHYHAEGRLDECDFGGTQVFHLHGLEFRERGGGAEAGSVGILTWRNGEGTFAYLDPIWLRSVTRHNWQHR